MKGADLIDKLLEKIPKAGIARAVNVSERWLQDYVNEKYDAVKKEIDVTPKKRVKSLSNVMKCGLL